MLSLDSYKNIGFETGDLQTMVYGLGALCYGEPPMLATSPVLNIYHPTHARIRRTDGAEVSQTVMAMTLVVAEASGLSCPAGL